MKTKDDRAAEAAQRVEAQKEAGVRPEHSPTNDEQIAMFLHCADCIREVQAIAQREGTASPRDYARLSVGWTPVGLQVWCVRHNRNVLHLDFEGYKHPGNQTAPRHEQPQPGAGELDDDEQPDSGGADEGDDPEQQAQAGEPKPTLH